ncbi:MAG TPA: bacillithiol biosynthesis cysteine-adding enzyme BshC [Bacteroidia bacterium]|nr:bacillithiol biosynthesis cysteine-adding enzyme BshC [Bacteroidia bacterium]HNC33573.1 bacillithiol biosynthesis cysteine-adding enzyme BshC [Bacteroidia bacterium]HNG84469.1 bacillithiol biosynthesis cysteine-adding enzyme BshC [Bacteroidia bacterium]HNI28971.1 bacillithiol biosynthesis cysteine-adding enzyme BshC [Bacteroidia bacterium]HNJ30612.1 bacillithiol biosynthesis cysteine-adding enzyme BshC [Bacteroidia bacterium]
MLAQSTYISFTDAGYSTLIGDYLSKSSFFKEYAAFQYDESGLKEALQKRLQYRTNRDSLCEVLEHQYSETVFQTDWKTSKSYSAIKSLKEEHTFTITTGHQLNIFTGPLYFIYKILTVIKQAEFLSQKNPDYKFVPVYWMASEDHDLAEVNHVSIDESKIEWQTKQKGAVGRMTTEGMSSVVETLKNHLHKNEYFQDIAEMFDTAYLKNATQANAIRSLVHSLFSKYGLVIIDADDKRLKQQAIEMFEDDLFKNTAFNCFKNLSEFEKKYGLQIHAREINLFYLADGERNRIVRNGENFEVADSGLSFASDDLKKQLNAYPERFSPNVVLRPLYQEVILPNIAYTGGPAEVHYWLQLKPIFDKLNIFYPMVVLRNGMLVVNADQANFLNESALVWKDLFHPTEQVVNIALKRKYVEELSLKVERDAIQRSYAEMEQRFKAIDVTLDKHVKAEWRRAEKRLMTSEKKLLRAFKKKQVDETRKIRNVVEKLFPNGKLQERIENVFPYLNLYGLQFIDDLYSVCNPIPMDFKIAVTAKK